MLFRKDEDAAKAIETLSRSWGEVDLCAGPFPFSFTDYYAAEMGPSLQRVFVSFGPLVSAERMAEWKAFTNQIEQQMAEGGRRTVNLDPGCLDCAKVILFSTKDFSHRIHLGSGIYAEVTLVYRGGEFVFLPWTYPDYRCEEYLSFFRSARERFKKQASELGRTPQAMPMSPLTADADRQKPL
mgnify:CR=1 FL=1